LGSDDVDENDEGNEDGTGMVILVTAWIYYMAFQNYLF
jgi:hypothetical protein